MLRQEALMRMYSVHNIMLHDHSCKAWKPAKQVQGNVHQKIPNDVT